jgi:predicted metal-binding membrane protein
VLGAALCQLLLQANAVARAVPLLSGLAVMCAGAFQFTAWKARHLACCRQAPSQWPTGAPHAWRHGLRLGQRCICSCAGLTVVLLVVGVMDLRAMAVVTAAITAERLASDGQRVARATGALAIAAGGLMMVRALWLS